MADDYGDDTERLAEVAKELAALPTSNLKKLLVDLGETSDGCIEKADLVRKAVGAIHRRIHAESAAGTRAANNELFPWYSAGHATDAPQAGAALLTRARPLQQQHRRRRPRDKTW
jgi:hypothetical protein